MSFGWGCQNYCYGYSEPAYSHYGYGRSFSLIVVLFILLIIVGAAWYC